MTHEKTYEEEVRALAQDGLLPAERRTRALASTGQRRIMLCITIFLILKTCYT